MGTFLLYITKMLAAGMLGVFFMVSVAAPGERINGFAAFLLGYILIEIPLRIVTGIYLKCRAWLSPWRLSVQLEKQQGSPGQSSFLTEHSQSLGPAQRYLQ